MSFPQWASSLVRRLPSGRFAPPTRRGRRARGVRGAGAGRQRTEYSPRRFAPPPSRRGAACARGCAERKPAQREEKTALRPLLSSLAPLGEGASPRSARLASPPLAPLAFLLAGASVGLAGGAEAEAEAEDPDVGRAPVPDGGLAVPGRVVPAAAAENAAPANRS